MDKLLITDARPEHYAEILRINEEFVDMLSPMDLAGLKAFCGMADMLKVALVDGKVAAFMIVLREGKTYDSPNYAWFSERLDSFLYVDRIAVGAAYRRLGVARRMYEAVFERARTQGVGHVAAEINLKPERNEASFRLHTAFGFTEQGVQYVMDGKKQVSMQVAKVN